MFLNICKGHRLTEALNLVIENSLNLIIYFCEVIICEEVHDSTFMHSCNQLLLHSDNDLPHKQENVKELCQCFSMQPLTHRHKIVWFYNPNCYYQCYDSFNCYVTCWFTPLSVCLMYS